MSRPLVSVITVTLDRPSLEAACASVESQTYPHWQHYVLGDGVPPRERRHPGRSCLGFSRSLGAEEPGLNMPDGTPNPLQRWALAHLDLGELVCFLDDDNQYTPTFMESMVAALQANPGRGLALCGVEDLRYGQQIAGRPQYGSCDNSGVMYRREVVKAIPFPRASPDREVIQDCEYIELCARRFGWVQVPEVLVRFGTAPDLPPKRGGIKLVSSWEEAIKAERLMLEGDPAGARDKLARIVADDPADAWSLFKLGEAGLVLGDRGLARRAWSRWLELTAHVRRPDAPWLRFAEALARLLVSGKRAASGAASAGLESIDRRLQEEPDNVDLWAKRGLLLLVQGADAVASLARVAVAADRSVETATRWDLGLLAALLPAPQIETALEALAGKNLSA
jgi:hypothetical protein